MATRQTPKTYGRYALGTLILIGLFNYMDRLSISILRVPNRSDLGLPDTQPGAVTGLVDFYQMPPDQVRHSYSEI